MTMTEIAGLKPGSKLLELVGTYLWYPYGDPRDLPDATVVKIRIYKYLNPDDPEFCFTAIPNQRIGKIPYASFGELKNTPELALADVIQSYSGYNRESIWTPYEDKMYP